MAPYRSGIKINLLMATYQIFEALTGAPSTLHHGSGMVVVPAFQVRHLLHSDSKGFVECSGVDENNSIIESIRPLVQGFEV